MSFCYSFYFIKFFLCVLHSPPPAPSPCPSPFPPSPFFARSPSILLLLSLYPSPSLSLSLSLFLPLLFPSILPSITSFFISIFTSLPFASLSSWTVVTSLYSLYLLPYFLSHIFLLYLFSISKGADAIKLMASVLPIQGTYTYIPDFFS